MKILITGANGMVARACIEYCRSIGDEITALTRRDLNISDAAAVEEAIVRIRPDTVINCAAYTDVDGAESDIDACYAANSQGVGNLAFACGGQAAIFVTISTDYVFDGEKDGFYSETDKPNPQSVYAQSKLEGEQHATGINPRSIIVRSGWIYGKGGTNFLSVMHRLLAEGRSVKAISDSYGTPTFADDLACRLRELAGLNVAGVFHAANTGPGTSYLGFAEKVCEIGGFDKTLLEKVSRDDLKRPAARPTNSRLSCLMSEKVGLSPMRNWEDALKTFLESEKGGK